MKNLYKFLFVIALAGVSFSCEVDGLQDNPNAPTPEGASLNDLYNTVQLTYANIFEQSESGPGDAARMYHSTAFTYENSTTPGSFNGLWNNVYAGFFPDFEALNALAITGGFDIHAGTAKVMKAHIMLTLVDLFGDVPFSEAGQGVAIISPGLDDGADVYQAAIDLLDEAIDQLDGTLAGAPAFDNFYGGDPDAWITAANTLKMKAALNMGDVAAFNAVVSGGDFIDTEAEDFQFNFGSNRVNPNSRHPFYNNHYEAGDGNYLSNYYMWMLLADKEIPSVDPLVANADVRDPRIAYYFYRKVDDAHDQDATTFSCHFSALPSTVTTGGTIFENTAGSNLDHWDSVDPRLRAETYCVLDEGYSGRAHLNGEGTPPDGPIKTTGGVYPFGGDFDANDYQDTRLQGISGGLGQGISPIMLSSFVDFMRAEAVLSLGAPGNARTLMESGIRKSMAKVVGFESLVSSKMSATSSVLVAGVPTDVTNAVRYGATDARIDAYVADVLTLYDAASTADQLDAVITEFYVASWGNGMEAYNMYRRTGYPGNMQPTLEPSAGQFPHSFFYPSNFVTRNANVDQKSLADKVFWAPAVTLY